ncbi:hypothetical protein L3X38_011628 [Prunus dulcis]|uniref:Uncharacterized protein n=1 Tax=Prunus dulcis TaxID=3755 RepID=A0AAD4WK22_PRUDU|nr:hypothetical protein L3X38_011628 [Prunus dulcis]
MMVGATKKDLTEELAYGELGDKDFVGPEPEEDLAEENEAEGEGPSVPNKIDVNMVVVLPSKFLALEGQNGYLDRDVYVCPASSEKPLYIMTHIEGMQVSNVFVDCGAMVNILP